MRTILPTCLLLFISPLIAAEGLDPRAQRAVDSYAEERRKLAADLTVEVVRLQQRLESLQAEHDVTLAKAASDTIRILKRSIDRRASIADQALVFREILRLDYKDVDAREFFTVLGTLDTELAVAGVEAEVDAANAATVDLVASMAAVADPSAHLSAGHLFAAGLPFRVYRQSAAGTGQQAYIIDYSPQEVTLYHPSKIASGVVQARGQAVVEGDIIHVTWEGGRGFVNIPIALGTEAQPSTAGNGDILVQIIPLDATEPPKTGANPQQRP